MQAPITNLDRLVELVRASLSAHSDDDTRAAIAARYRQFGLLDEQRQWAHPKLAEIGESLFPASVGVSDLIALLDEMAEHVASNRCLMAIVRDAPPAVLDALRPHVEEEGDEVLFGAMTYAYTLQQLSSAQREDVEVLAATREVYDKVRSSIDSHAHFGRVEQLKIASVERPMRNWIRVRRSGKVSPRLLRFVVPFNILQITMVDVVARYWGNAFTGLVLALQRPGGRPEPRTGAGPTTLSEDRRALAFHMALPREWADLYTCWNLTALTQWSYYPYPITKLLIPLVHDYGDAPAEYIYNRGLALYNHLHWALFGRAFDMISVRSLDWSEPRVSRYLGEVNARSALDYDSAVLGALGSPALRAVGVRVRGLLGRLALRR